jgi:hypothetical protein
MKKIIILSAIGILAMLSMDKVSAQPFFSAKNADSVTIYYNIKSPSTVEVFYNYVNQNQLYSGTVNIPDTVTDQGITYTVIAIGISAFSSCKDLYSVTIPNTATSIGKEAFFGCSKLTTITIPDAVISIGDASFSGCNKLTSISLGNSIAIIGDMVFTSCNSLTQINVDENNPNYSDIDGVLFTKQQDAILQYPIGKKGAYIIPNTVVNIGKNTFFDCLDLTSIIIPSSVTTIGSNAFAYCTELKEMGVKPTTPPTIESNTFTEVPNSIPVYVCGSANDYRNANYWGDFTNIIEDCNSIKDISPENKITIYPNPATDNVKINLPENIHQVSFTLYDMQGRILARQNINNGEEIPIRDFAAGIYIYNISTKNQSYQGKIVRK